MLQGDSPVRSPAKFERHRVSSAPDVMKASAMVTSAGCGSFFRDSNPVILRDDMRPAKSDTVSYIASNSKLIVTK